MGKSTRKPRSVRLGARADVKEADLGRGLSFGDTLKVERRYVVDGVVTCVTDKGRYGGIQVVGSVEHILVEGKDGVRMIPLASVSEIEVVERTKERAKARDDDPAYL